MPSPWINNMDATNIATPFFDYDILNVTATGGISTVDGERERRLKNFMKNKSPHDIEKIIDFIDNHNNDNRIWNFILAWDKEDILRLLKMYDSLLECEKLGEDGDVIAFLKELMSMSPHTLKKALLRWFEIFDLGDYDDKLVNRVLKFRDE